MNPNECEYIVVNGILTHPSDTQAWTDRAERWYQDRNIICTRYEYFSGALTRFWGQGRRVNQIKDLLLEIEKPIVYIGHSNGCELFTRLIKSTKIEFEAVHLLAAATESDFEDNGYNEAFKECRINKLYLYCSEMDHTLKKGNQMTGWMKFLGLGYGALGLYGPKNMSAKAALNTVVDWQNEYRHSDWFKPWIFSETMQKTLRT